MEESFTNHSLNWFCEAGYFATELRKCGSKIQLLLINGKREAGLSCRIQNSNDNCDAQGKKKKRQNTTQELFIPHPLKNVWKIKQKYGTWEKLSPSMPSSFRWLVGVGSQMCEAPRIQLLSLVCLMQNKIKKPQ